MRGVPRYGALLAFRRQRVELFALKKLEISLPPIKEHPTVRDFVQRFTSQRARNSNEDCDVIVRVAKFNKDFDKQEIKATYINGEEEILNHDVSIEDLTKYFFYRRLRIEAEADFEEGFREDEENPFFDQALIDEAKTKKKPAGQKKVKAVKDD